MARSRASVPFPANPFVALADLLMLVVLLLVLVLVQHSLISAGMLKRMAVERKQVQLNDRILRLTVQAHGTAPIEQYYVDGDLQRFRMPGWQCFDHGSATLKPAAQASLVEMGRILREYHGENAEPGYGLYKRVEVHGNVDRGECAQGMEWKLSLRRAEAAASALLQGGLYERVLVVSGVGANYPAKEGRSPHNRRVDIVVVYSADNVIKYQSRQQMERQDGTTR